MPPRIKSVMTYNVDLLAILIKALVFRKLFYCSAVWSNTSNRNICKLQLKLQHIQNFASWMERENWIIFLLFSQNCAGYL